MKGQYEATAIERLKTFGPQSIAALDLGDLRGYADAKGFDRTVIRKMAERGSFGELFRDLVLRSEAVRGEEIDAIASAIEVVDPTASREYRGTDLQNFQIDTAIANSGIARGLKRYGSGASTFISPQAHVPHGIRNVPIAIVGYGAAGIMAAHTLLRLGFENITAYEKAKPLGIWAHQNVHGLSRNNPLELHFFDGVLKPAPGDGTEVKNFLNGLISIRPKEKRVVGIEPGTLKHRLNFADGTSAEYPIVINAMGLGRPKTVSDPRRMKTVTGENTPGYDGNIGLSAKKSLDNALY